MTIKELLNNPDLTLEANILIQSYNDTTGIISVVYRSWESNKIPVGIQNKTITYMSIVNGAGSEMNSPYLLIEHSED